jgi:hypothetical protein
MCRRVPRRGVESWGLGLVRDGFRHAEDGTEARRMDHQGEA